jgi:hypothetical protein
MFSLSAAADLRQALALAERDDEIATMWDDLSFGPINPPAADLRAHWIEKELGYGWLDECGEATTKFWSTVFSEDRRRIVWTSRRATAERSGFLEFVYRLGDLPCDFIEITEATIPRRDENGKIISAWRPIGSGEIPAAEFAANKLWDLARPLTDELRAECRRKWAALRSENAALRIVDADLDLISAPITYFDQRLLAAAKISWLKAARVVGEVLVSFIDEDIAQVGDLVLASRLRALVEAGQLESQGDLSNIRYSEVRLPQQGGRTPT